MKNVLLTLIIVVVGAALYLERTFLDLREEVSYITAAAYTLAVQNETLRRELTELKNRPVEVRTVNKTKVVVKEVIVTESGRLRKNSLMLGVGAGYRGHEAVKEPGLIRIKNTVKPVISLDYSRKVSDKARMGVGVMSNGSLVIKMGRDF